MAQTFTPVIHSIGTAVPEFKISQAVHHSILENANGLNRAERLILKTVYNNSGIESRHSVLEEFGRNGEPGNLIFHPAGKSDQVSISRRMNLFEEYAPQLCIQAIDNCFSGNKISIKEVTHLVTFSCTGMSAPGLDIQLIEKLGLNRNIERMCINFMGCYAGISALRFANHIVSSDEKAVVLLSGVELCTLHYQKSNSHDQLMANAIFGDGAAAVLVTSSSYLNSDTPKLSLHKFYSEFMPSGINDMAWRIGDYGFDIRLSTYVPELIHNNIASLIDRLFTDAGLQKNDIDWYAFHPGGVKILQACEKALNLQPSQNNYSYEVLRQYGNMSSVTILFVLKKYLENLTPSDCGKKILACAFGPGLTMETMILNTN